MNKKMSMMILFAVAITTAWVAHSNCKAGGRDEAALEVYNKMIAGGANKIVTSYNCSEESKGEQALDNVTIVRKAEEIESATTYTSEATSRYKWLYGETKSGKMYIKKEEMYSDAEIKEVVDAMLAKADIDDSDSTKIKVQKITDAITMTFYYKLEEHNFVKAYNSDKGMCCEGYSDLFYYTCKAEGIDVLTVVSGTDDDLGGHQYNAVRFSGDKYTMIDITATDIDIITRKFFGHASGYVITDPFSILGIGNGKFYNTDKCHLSVDRTQLRKATFIEKFKATIWFLTHTVGNGLYLTIVALSTAGIIIAREKHTSSKEKKLTFAFVVGVMFITAMMA